uniref:Uncharacterized protein n=1 Tax=Pseudomonas phage Arace01 TaxID=3138526 RepID=A0AAU6VZ96_9VIRU
MDLFQQASRVKLRFNSPRGELSVEQLWDVPLTSRNGFDLDNIAKGANRDLKDATEESFVQTTSPQATILNLRMDVIKSVIATKIAERDAAETKEKRRVERDRLIALLADKQDAALQELSAEEIQARLEALKD